MNSPLFPSLVCHLYSYEVCSHFARIINHRCNCSFAWYAALFIFLQKTRENAFYLLILTSEVITRAQPFLQGPVHNGIIRTKQVVDFSHLKSGVDPQPWFWADESWNAKNERDVLLMSPPCCSCILKRSPNVASCREMSFNFPLKISPMCGLFLSEKISVFEVHDQDYGWKTLRLKSVHLERQCFKALTQLTFSPLPLSA